MKEELEIEQLRDLLLYLEQTITDIQDTTDHGKLRIAVSDYTETKRKFEEMSRLSTKGELLVETVTEVIKISKKFDDRVRDFQAHWSEEVQKIALEQEEPSQLQNRNESNTSRINDLTSTAMALKSQADEAQRRDTDKPLFNMSIDGESKVLVEVALDNKDYKDTSIRSLSYEPSNSCRCRVL